MKSYISLWDRLFGKRVQIESTREDGSSFTVEVTEAWLNRAVREGKISPVAEDTALRFGHADSSAQLPIEVARKNVEELLQQFARALDNDSSVLQKSVGDQSLKPLQYWLCVAPNVLFRTMLVEQDSASFPVPLVQNARVPNGKGCAAVTQAYCAFLLLQMLTNSVELRKAMGIRPDQVTGLFSTTFRGDAADALARYIDMLSVPFGMPGAVDPRDWPLRWFWDVADLLIPDRKEQARVLGEWNDNMLARLEFVVRETTLLGPLRKGATEYVRTGALPAE